MSSPSGDRVRVLHVVGSPKAEASVSTRVARAFLQACQQANSECEVTTLDVWNEDLQPFDGELALAKLAPIVGEKRTAEQEVAWSRVEAVVREFDSFDKILISAPMWNFSIPYRLKHYIDLLIQPGLTFGLDAKLQHTGLLKDRPVQLVLTRSSPLPLNSPDDFQLPYLKHVLSFIGITNVKTLIVEGTTLPQTKREDYLAKHCDLARTAAATF